MALSGGFLDEECGRLAQEAQERQKRIATRRVQAKAIVVANNHQLSSGATKDIPPPKDVDLNVWKDALAFVDEMDNNKPVGRKNGRFTEENKVETMSNPSFHNASNGAWSKGASQSKSFQGGFSRTTSQVSQEKQPVGLDREVWGDIADMVGDTDFNVPLTSQKAYIMSGEKKTSGLSLCNTSSTRSTSEKPKPEEWLRPKPSSESSLGIEYHALSSRPTSPGIKSKSEEWFQHKPTAKSSLGIDYGAPSRRSSAPDNTSKLEEWLHPKSAAKTSLGIDYDNSNRRSTAPDNTAKLEKWLHPKSAAKTSLNIDYGTSNRKSSAPDNTAKLEEWLHPKSTRQASQGRGYCASNRKSSAPDNTSKLEEWLYPKSTTQASQGRGYCASNRKSSAPDNTLKLEEWLHPKPAAKSSLSIDYSADPFISGEKISSSPEVSHGVYEASTKIKQQQVLDMFKTKPTFGKSQEEEESTEKSADNLSTSSGECKTKQQRVLELLYGKPTTSTNTAAETHTTNFTSEPVETSEPVKSKAKRVLDMFNAKTEFHKSQEEEVSADNLLTSSGECKTKQQRVLELLYGKPPTPTNTAAETTTTNIASEPDEISGPLKSKAQRVLDMFHSNVNRNKAQWDTHDDREMDSFANQKQTIVAAADQKIKAPWDIDDGEEFSYVKAKAILMEKLALETEEASNASEVPFIVQDHGEIDSCSDPKEEVTTVITEDAPKLRKVQCESNTDVQFIATEVVHSQPNIPIMDAHDDREMDSFANQKQTIVATADQKIKAPWDIDDGEEFSYVKAKAILMEKLALETEEASNATEVPFIVQDHGEIDSCSYPKEEVITVITEEAPKLRKVQCESNTDVQFIATEAVHSQPNCVTQKPMVPRDIGDGDESPYATDKPIFMEKLSEKATNPPLESSDIVSYKQNIKEIMNAKAPESTISPKGPKTDAAVIETEARQYQPNSLAQKLKELCDDMTGNEKSSCAEDKAIIIEELAVKKTKTAWDVQDSGELDSYSNQDTKSRNAGHFRSRKTQSQSNVDVPFNEMDKGQSLHKGVTQKPKAAWDISEIEQSPNARNKAIVNEKLAVNATKAAWDVQGEREMGSYADVKQKATENINPEARQSLPKTATQKPKAALGVIDGKQCSYAKDKAVLKKKLTVKGAKSTRDVQDNAQMGGYADDKQKAMDIVTGADSKPLKSQSRHSLSENMAQKSKSTGNTIGRKKSSYAKDTALLMQKLAVKEAKAPRNVQDVPKNDSQEFENEKVTKIINAEALDITITITKRRNKTHQDNHDSNALPLPNKTRCKTDIPGKMTKSRQSGSPKISAEDVSLDHLLELVKDKFKQEKRVHSDSHKERVGGTSRQLTEDEKFVDISSVDTETVEGDTPAARRAREWIRKKYNVEGKYQPAEEETPVHEHHDQLMSARRSRRQDECRCLNKTRHRHRSTSGKPAPPRSTPEREQRQRPDFADISREIQPSKSLMVRLRSGMRRLGSRFVSIFTACSCGSSRS